MFYQGHKNIGRVDLAGQLLALGYFVSQEQLGRVVRLVDPEGIYEWVGIIKYNFLFMITCDF